MSNLNLNEAIVTVNITDIAGTIDVYHQNIECFGCPLEKLTTLSERQQDIVLDTRYGLQLEFRQNDTLPALCSYDRLDLNSHGRYKIDISPNTSIAEANCNLAVLYSGECVLCPFALLICFLVAITVIAKLYEWIQCRKQPKEDERAGEPAKQEGRPKQDAAVSTSETADPRLDIESISSDGSRRNDESHAVYISETTTEPQVAQKPRKRQRVDALDAFRGFTITGMIMVNYGGAGYMLLEHRPWDGLTMADFVFPFFIFSMGASIALSMKSMINRHGLTSVFLKIIRRSTILMALGLALNSMWLDGRSLHYLRITGVLQRFSISYLVVAMIYALELGSNKWLRQRASASSTRRPLSSKITGTVLELLTAASCLSIYVFVTYFLDYSTQCPVGYVGPGGKTDHGQLANCTGGAAAWLDHSLLGNSHLYNDTELKHVFGTDVSHDPEGLLGYTTSILLTLAGLQCGKILSRRQVRSDDHRARVVGMIQWMIVMAVLSVAVVANPINKKLWSFSFVAVTGAAAYLVVISFYILLDVYHCQRVYILRLLLSAGKNAIFLYIGHSLVHKMLPWYFSVDETSHMQLLMRLAWSTYVWLLVASYMASKSLFIKV